jgi:hypothetical protein
MWLCTMQERDQPAVMHPMISALQFVLHDTPLGQWAVDSVLRTSDMLKSILEWWGDGSSSWDLLCRLQRYVCIKGERG